MGASTEVKIISDQGSSLTIGGYGVVWGGRDIVGEYFTKKTDFWFDRLTQTPMVLYQHGQDGTLKQTVVGKVTTKRSDSIGLWVEAQIDAAKQYADAIRKLVEKGVLGWSSGSVPHLVQRKAGKTKGTTEITSWPIVELSLTPTPAEPRTIGIKELKSLAALEPALKDMVRDAEKAVEGSLEDRIEMLRLAACELLGYCSVVGTFDDYLLVSTYGGDQAIYWRVPYSIDSNGEPTLGDPQRMEMSFAPTKARQDLPASDYDYIDSDGGKHLDISDAAHVRAAMARFNQTHFESPEKKRQAARKILARARSMSIEVADDSAVAQAASGGSKSMPDLPDDAFAYIQPGGTKDGAITAPKSLRHFPHHGEDGEVDVALLEQALAESEKSDHAREARAHLLRHAKAAGLHADLEHDDAHSKFWSAKSACGQLLVIGTALLELAEVVVPEQKSMDLLGYQDPEQRIRPEPLQRLKELEAWLEVVIDHAEQAENGDDGTARAEELRQRLALLEV